MLEAKDLQAIQQIVTTVVETRAAKTEETLRAEIKASAAQTEEKLRAEIKASAAQTEQKLRAEFHSALDRRLRESENMILKEIERSHEILERRIDKIEANITRLNQTGHLISLEHSNSELFLKIAHNLEIEVEILKKKIA